MNKVMPALCGLFLLLSSCYFTLDTTDYLNKEYNIPEGPFSSVQEIMIYTATQIEYSYSNYAQTPQETYDTKEGDCLDLSLLAMYLIKRDLGIIPSLGIGDIIHAFVVVNGDYWEPQYGGIVTDIYIKSFDHINTLDYVSAIKLCYD